MKEKALKKRTRDRIRRKEKYRRAKLKYGLNDKRTMLAAMLVAVSEDRIYVLDWWE